MSTYEANWETDALVTAEAVFGIGSPPRALARSGQEAPRALRAERPQTESTADQAAD